MQNTRLIQMKSNLQMYDYRVLHLKGTSNNIADVLFRCPVWINLDSTSGPDKGIELDDGNDYANRVMSSKPHLLKDNPLLRDLE